MKQLILSVDDEKFELFLEFVKTLDYVQVENLEKKALEELQHSLKQVKCMREGKLAKPSIQDFLNEL